MMKKIISSKTKYKIQEKIYNFSILLEIIVAIIIIIAICISSFNMLYYMITTVSLSSDTNMFREYLDIAFDIVIGIEFVKMLCRHNLNSVIEVLLFAISREMIITHTSPLENFLTVAAIAILFLVRKYLFISSVDKPGHTNQNNT
ncbi:MAG: hypothetical protein IJ583_02730 [Firmicutes bacterium]|nr:hypothetical protein [Bacillota bacterium]